MKKVEVGETVLVEQCWEDETGTYHDEYAEVLSVDPLQLNFLNVRHEVAMFLLISEFTEEDISYVEPVRSNPAWHTVVP